MNAELISGLLMAGVLVVAIILATRPWWRKQTDPEQARRAANIAAFRLRLVELEAERLAGTVPEDEAQAMRAELESRLVVDAGDGSPDLVVQDGGRKVVAVVVVALLLGAFSTAGYLYAGGWRAQREIAANPSGRQTREQQLQNPQIAAMVAKLADSLKQAPDDPKGWAMLGRSYSVLQRFGEAEQAYAEANNRSAEPNPEWLADQAEARAFADGRRIDEQALGLFAKALSANPNDGKSLWYSGLAAAQANEYEKAREYWLRLLKTPDLAPEMKEVLIDSMKTIDQETGTKTDIDVAGAGDASAQAPVAPTPPTAATPPSGSPSAPSAALSIKVSVAPELVAKIPAGATLFLFAKADGGPQIPLAVQRLPGAKLPLDLKLDDTMSMAPQLKLSQFPRYVVTARLSSGGGVQAQAGDLEGKINATQAQLGGEALQLTIDHIVP